MILNKIVEYSVTCADDTADAETNNALLSGCKTSTCRKKAAYAVRHGMVSLGDLGLSCLGVPHCHFESPE